MRIVFDATSLQRKITGIEYYSLNLIKNLLKLDIKNEYVVLFRSNIPTELNVLRGISESFICPVNDQFYCEQVWIPGILKKIKADVVHFPAFPPSFLIDSKLIMTIHDATMWKYPHTTSWKNKLYMKPLTELALRRAEKIITVSESSRDEISSYARIPKDRIVNTYESINERFRILSDVECLRKAKGLPENFILSVGSIEPRKNLTALLEAYSYLKKEHGISHKLVLIGRNAWGKSAITNKIRDLGIENDIIMTGYVSDEDLVIYYNLADVFVYPSLYEGFGLPPLEAMACGTPVVSSNISSISEILGDAALLGDPHNFKELGENIYSLIRDKDLRKNFIKKGSERVKFFNWEEVARKTSAVYESIL